MDMILKQDCSVIQCCIWGNRADLRQLDQGNAIGAQPTGTRMATEEESCEHFEWPGESTECAWHEQCHWGKPSWRKEYSDVHACARVCTCVHVYMCECVSVYMCAGMCACVYICVCVCDVCSKAVSM